MARQVRSYAAACAAAGIGARRSRSNHWFRSRAQPNRIKDEYPAAPCFVFGFLALLCAAGDVRMLLRGGVFGAHRIVRNLWRMCFALLIPQCPSFVRLERRRMDSRIPY